MEGSQQNPLYFCFSGKGKYLISFKREYSYFQLGSLHVYFSYEFVSFLNEN